MLLSLAAAAGGCGPAASLPSQQISWAGAPPSTERMVADYVRRANDESADEPGEALFDPAFYAPPTPYFTYRGNDDAETVALSARVGSTLPPIDVFYTDLYWFQNFERQWLEPLDDLTIPVGGRPRRLRDVLHPDLLKACQIGGVLYAAPLSINGNCLYYRSDLVPSPPRSWPDLIAVCREVLARQPQGSPLEIGLTFHWQDLHGDMYPIMWGYGGGPPSCLDEAGNLAAPRLASEANLQAIELVYNLIHVEKLTEDVARMDARRLGPERDLHRAFVEGRTLFLIDWTNRAARIHQAVRQAAGSGQPPAFDPAHIGLAPIPHGPEENHSYSTNGSWGWVIAQDPRSRRSIDFVRQLCTPQAQLHFFERHAEFPIFREPDLRSLAGWPATEARLSGYHRQLIELVYGAGDRPNVEFRDRPSLKQVNRIIEGVLHQCLTASAEGEPAFPREFALSQLARADEEITQFLRRLKRLGIDCACPQPVAPAAAEPPVTAAPEPADASDQESTEATP